ncbi:MAG: superoxide dismutase [bacterium]
MTTIENRFHQQIDAYKVKDFGYFFENIEGISNEMLNQHLELYKRYVGKVNDITKMLKTADISKANNNYSEKRNLTVELSHNLNAVVLHELYFSNITDKDTEPTTELITAIERDFGSWQNYLEDLKAVGKSMRGWAFTAYNYRDGRLYNFGIDGHNQNLPVFVMPLLVLDVWEHAYTLDYGINRAEYIDTFIENINWYVVSSRLESALKNDSE